MWNVFGGRTEMPNAIMLIPAPPSYMQMPSYASWHILEWVQFHHYRKIYYQRGMKQTVWIQFYTKLCINIEGQVDLPRVSPTAVSVNSERPLFILGPSIQLPSSEQDLCTQKNISRPGNQLEVYNVFLSVISSWQNSSTPTVLY